MPWFRTALPCLGCATALLTAAALARAVTFTNMAPRAGILNSWDGNPNLHGAGALLEDLDADGDQDVICVNDEGRPPAYYENRGDINGDGLPEFVERGLDVGFVDIGNGKGVCAADVDNDGLLDVIFTVYDRRAEGALVPAYTSSVRYFHNEGAGSFRERTADAGLTVTRLGASGLSAADYDGDGWVDLFVCNRGLRREGGGVNILYRNRGDGTFADVTNAAGLGGVRRPTLQSVFTDLDGDADLDLFVATDRLHGNQLYRNNGDGTFTDVSTETGAGTLMNGMGVAAGDYDGDGAIDLFISNTSEGHVLLRNQGDGTFADVSIDMADFTGRVGWGTAWVDCDNNGWSDLYVANFGRGGWGSLRNGAMERDQLFWNASGLGFVDVAEVAGCADQSNSFGLACGDVDGDGAPDILVTNDHDPPALLRNNGPGGGWLALRLAGVESNAAAIGARVEVFAGDRRIVREVQAGTSYLSHNALEVHVGVGDAERADSVCIRWPNGTRETLRDLAPGARYWVLEGHGIARGAVPLAYEVTEAGGLPLLRWTAAAEPGVQHWAIDRARAGETPERVAVLRIHGRAFTWVDLGAHDLPAGTYRYIVSAQSARGEETVVWHSGEWNVGTAEVVEGVHVRLGARDARLRFTTRGAAPIGARVLDLAGRLVQQFIDAAPSAGEREIRWDMRDMLGRTIPAGIYFVDAWVGDRRTSTKAAILRP